MEKKWLWTNIVIISILIILLLVLISSGPKKNNLPPINYWANFNEVAKDNNATFEQLNSAFKASCPEYKDCEPSNTLWYIMRALGYYNVKPSAIMSKEETKKLTDFYEKAYSDDKYQSTFIPMFPRVLKYMTKEDAYQWLIKLGNYKTEDYTLHMAQMKSVIRITDYLNQSDITKLKTHLGNNYNVFYNNVCWNQMHQFPTPSKEAYFYLAYKTYCQILSDEELNTFKQLSEKDYSNPDEKRWANLIGALIKNS